MSASVAPQPQLAAREHQQRATHVRGRVDDQALGLLAAQLASRLAARFCITVTAVEIAAARDHPLHGRRRSDAA
jgi:hypothetical protein